VKRDKGSSEVKEPIVTLWRNEVVNRQISYNKRVESLKGSIN
jgi:hypothetical protein